MAFVLGLRGPSGFAVFVYLYMQQSGESAVYVPSSGTVPAEQFQGEEAEALGFVENVSRGVWRLTELGYATTDQPPTPGPVTFKF